MAEKVRAAKDATDAQEDEVEDSAVTATEWLASESRKALLADLGVGTIDQVLLGVLPAKHQALRLAGLGDKVLIVDEAHAYDAYMGAELERLIAFQAALGGSTIVLSATLPKIVKDRLAKSWSKAAGAPAPALANDAYPCATLLAPALQTPIENAKAPRADLPRVLNVARLAEADAAVERIGEAAQAGAAVAWVRNTVDDVIAGAALPCRRAPPLQGGSHLRLTGVTGQVEHEHRFRRERAQVSELSR